MKNDLLANESLRKKAYRVYYAVGLVLGAIPVYYGAVPDAGRVPGWVLGALAVYAFVGAPLFGETAAQHVQQALTPKDVQQAKDEGYDLGYADATNSQDGI